MSAWEVRMPHKKPKKQAPKKGKDELTEDQLERVAGGGGGESTDKNHKSWIDVLAPPPPPPPPPPSK